MLLPAPPLPLARGHRFFGRVFGLNAHAKGATPIRTMERFGDGAKATFLVIDDDEALRTRLVQALRERDFSVAEASSCASGLALARALRPQRALVDLRMPGEWGLRLVADLKAALPDLKIVVFTAYGSIATAIDALRLGAVNYLQKPASIAEILHAFEPCLEGGEAAAEPHGPERLEDVPSLARAEWEHINRVLTECGGNIRRAAKLLGLHRRTLQRKLMKWPVLR